ncbi:MAG TPA: hypothetical protein VFC51_07915 [Chloroflexota bacterium]|nr:hypothetical protein [Chloroflexota bacterium]
MKTFAGTLAVLLCAASALVLPGTARAQAACEAAATGSVAITTGGAAAALGNAITGALDRVSRSIEEAGADKPSPPPPDHTGGDSSGDDAPAPAPDSAPVTC